MRQFYDWDGITQATHIGFSVPGFSQSATGGSYCAFIQAEPVFRIPCQNSNVDWLHVIVESPDSGFTVSDSVDFTSRCIMGRTVYVPMGRLLRSLYSRSFSGITATGTEMAGIANVTFRLLDASNNITAEFSTDIRFYDSVGAVAPDRWDPRWPMLPDRLVLSSQWDGNNYMVVPKASDTGAPGTITFYSGGEVLRTVSYDPDGGTVGFRLQRTTRAVTAFAVGDSRLHYVRVEWTTCDADRAMLVWWSPVVGGWKCRPAIVRGYAAGTESRSEASKGFGPAMAVESMESMAVRFEDLTVNDYLYYRDVMMSDEVYIIRNEEVSPRSSFETVRVPVTVSGNVPDWGLAKSGNMDFIINYQRIKAV